jgi:hypothetical protein
VVGVAVRDQDRAQGESKAGQRGFHRHGVAGVHHHRVATVVDQPQVVVFEGRDRLDHETVVGRRSGWVGVVHGGESSRCR